MEPMSRSMEISVEQGVRNQLAETRANLQPIRAIEMIKLRARGCLST